MLPYKVGVSYSDYRRAKNNAVGFYANWYITTGGLYIPALTHNTKCKLLKLNVKLLYVFTTN